MAEEPPLAYFQPSPVRGQLEPWDPKTRANWRYLQCTDTPNELKVLLPPRTAQVYAYLLSQEKYELERGTSASWERLLHLRHLKERLLRKCNRLSRLSTVRQTTDVAFRTIHAPPDFTLKELEKWYRHRDDLDNVPASFKRQQSTTNRPKSPVATRKAAVTAKHSHGTRASTAHTRSHRNTQTHTSRRHSDSDYTRSSDNGSQLGYADYEEDKTLPSVPEDESFVHVSAPLPEGGTYAADDYSLRGITSPDPLPHPYRPRDSTLGELHEQLNSQFPSEQQSQDPSFPEPQLDIPPNILEPMFPIPQAEPPPERPTLHRRRSSLKRSSSRQSLKSVAWAMDMDQQRSRYDFAVGEIETAGDDLDVARTAHREEIMLLQDLHRSVSEIKERLRLDEERIRLEREKLVTAEEAVRHQEERLRLTFDQLEINESRYQTKVITALDEAQRTLLSTSRREETIYEEN